MTMDGQQEPFARLSHEYIFAKRQAGIENIAILNSYSRAEIDQWFQRGMEKWDAPECMWDFSPMEYEFMHHGDGLMMEGVDRIFDNKKMTRETRRFIGEAVLEKFIKALPDTDEKRFRHLCDMAMHICPATLLLRKVLSLLRRAGPEISEERLHLLHDVALCTPQTPKTSVKVLHRILSGRALRPEYLGATLRHLVQLDPEGLQDHLHTLTLTAHRMTSETAKIMTPWLVADLLEKIGADTLRRALQSSEWKWLLDVLEPAVPRR